MNDITKPEQKIGAGRQNHQLIKNDLLTRNELSGADVQVGKFNINLRELTAVLLSDEQVDECSLMVRENKDGHHEIVAYVVPSGPFSPSSLHERIRSYIPEIEPLCSFVAISNLPFTTSGRIDEDALAKFEVIDFELVQRWENQIRSIKGVDQCAVVVSDMCKPKLPLHISDLQVNWQSEREKDTIAVSAIQLDPEEAVLGRKNRKPLSLSEGGPLFEEPDTPTTLPGTLKRAANYSPDKGLIFIESDGSELFQCYRDMLSNAERILAGLRRLGLKPQDKVIFQFDHNRDFLTVFWGCILGGIVPVPIAVSPSYTEINSSVNKLYHTWVMLDKPIILTNESLAPSIKSLSDLLKIENLCISTVEDLMTNQPAPMWHESKPDDVALMMLTSGSTGAPKGVMLNHKNLISRSAGSVQMNKFSCNDTSLNWMPLDHVAGIVFFHLRDVFTGCTQIHAPSEMVLAEPLRWLNWIERYQVTITFAPNFAFGLVNQHEEEIRRRKWNLSSMKFVLNGAEAIVAKTARRFLQLLIPNGLPDNAMHPAWGMSETSSGVVYGDRFSLDNVKDGDSFVEVGSPIPGLSIRIVDDQGGLLLEDEVGRLQVSGHTVTSGYYKNPEANDEAFTEDGWFNTGDMGFLRDGRLTITGRAKDVIIINSVNYYSHEIEGVVEEVKGVDGSFTAACAIRDPGNDTDKLAIFFHSLCEDDRQLKDLLIKIRKAVTQRVGVYPSYLIPVQRREIPKTEIGKIQRSQLNKLLEQGEFDRTLKRVDLLLENENTIPDWFFEKTWRRKEKCETHLHSLSFIEMSLVFLDQLGLGEHVCKKLKSLKAPFISVASGTNFCRIDSERYAINIHDPADYLRLFEKLIADGIRIDRIFHLFTYSSSGGESIDSAGLEQAQDNGIYSLLFLIQALAKYYHRQSPIHLFVVSSNIQPILPEDQIDFEKSTVLGFSKTTSQEIPWLNCRNIDLNIDEPGVNADVILKESLIFSKESEVAYRYGNRWVSNLQMVDLVNCEKRELPFSKGGMYLLTGGLGGIGIEIAKYLLEHFQAKLLLVGRTKLNEEFGSGIVANQESIVSEKKKSYQLLKKLSGDVIYEAGDVCDLNWLERTIKNKESKWDCELDGIIHLAGIYQERSLIEETKASISETLRPKVLGSWVIAQILGKRPNCTFIGCSSVTSYFGGALVGAYSAANCFIGYLSKYIERISSNKCYCYHWSSWDQVGISADYGGKDLVRAKGFLPISAKKGVDSLMAGMLRGRSTLFVGLDCTNPHIRRHLENIDLRIKRLHGYYTFQNGAKIFDKLGDIVVQDRFGAKSNCDFHQILDMPLLDTGEIDTVALSSILKSENEKKADKVAPSSDLELSIASVWRKVLRRDRVSVNDNFFELGGNSLLMAQLNEGIKKILKTDISMTEMFRYPTVAAFAEHLLERGAEKPSSEFQQSHDRGAKRRMRMRKRKEL